MFMFGLACFKARKAKTIAIFLNILRNRSGFMWLQGKWCLYIKQRLPSQYYKIVYAFLLYSVTT